MTEITLPPNTRAAGQGNPPVDMNKVVTALMAMDATSWCLPSGDSSGATDAANINDAISANGVAFLGTGAWYLNATVGPLATNQWVVCEPGVIINWLGTGDCFRFVDSSTYTTRTVQGGGILGRPIIDGTGDGAGSTGVHAGDILGLRIDVAVQNFSKSGDIGVQFDNQNYWSEQAVATIWTNSCTQDVVFDCGGASTSTGSYDRGDFTIFLSKKTFTGDCVVLQNGAQILGGRLRLFGNINSSSSSFTHAVLTMTGATPGGHSPSTNSGLAQCGLDINVESDLGLAHTFQTISFGGSSNVIVQCHGNVSFGSGNQFTQSNIASVASQFQFVGPVVGDPTLEEVLFNTRLSVSSQAFFFSSLYLGEISAPSTPSGGGDLYVDSGGALHYLGPGAQDTVVAGSGAPAGSGQYLCAPVSYAPGSPTTLSTTSATLAAVSSSNVNTGSFTAPPSGKVMVGVSASVQLTSSDVAAFALAAHGGVSPVVGNVITCESNSLTNVFPVQLQFLVTGLTPGTSYNFDLLFANAGGGTLRVLVLGQTSTTPTGSTGAPVLMTVQAV